MATVDECEAALRRLADRLDAYRDTEGEDRSAPDRRLACTVRDLDVTFAARLEHGRLTDVDRADDARAQIRFSMTGDDLLALVDGTLAAPAAWLSGRLTVKAGFRDLLRLRSLF